MIHDTQLNTHECDFEMKQNIFSKLHNKTLLDVFEIFNRDSTQYSFDDITKNERKIKFFNKNYISKNNFRFFHKSKFVDSVRNFKENIFEKSCLLKFDLMKSILGHINTNSIEENNIISVPIYCITFSKNDDMIITGDNNG